jgi:hypothetical protein
MRQSLHVSTPTITLVGRYKQSLEDPEAFWTEIGKDFHWEKKWDTLSKVLAVNKFVLRGCLWLPCLQVFALALPFEQMWRRVQGAGCEVQGTRRQHSRLKASSPLQIIPKHERNALQRPRS